MVRADDGYPLVSLTRALFGAADVGEELKAKLPDYSEVLDSVRAAAKESALQTETGTRPHRGED